MALHQLILDHYEDPFHQGRCDYPTHRGQAGYAPCEGGAAGDKIQVELRIGNRSTGVIDEAWFDGEGCQIALAAASILMEHVEGRSMESAEQLSESQFIELCQADFDEQQRKCCLVAYVALINALQAPIDGTDTDGPTLAGPHLGDEC